MIDFGLATNRNTKCYRLTVADVGMVISYGTVIAAQSKRLGAIRQANHWGPTTGRHFKEVVPSYARVIDDQAEFMRIVGDDIRAGVLNTFTEKLIGGSVGAV